ncbi:glycosyltransferase [Chloroflexota bacterium]
MPFNVSVGICAYNEEKNIGNLLDSLLLQETNNVMINQIIVVSSACADRTDEIVLDYQNNNPIIKLIRQPDRRGKASAINLFLKESSGDICVLISADIIMVPGSMELLCSPYVNPEIGMTGGHPIPVNCPNRVMGYVSHLIWRMSHELSLESPKLGECISFRNTIRGIPEDTAVDEAVIEEVIRGQGYLLHYVPEALVYNMGPNTIKDYINQRRRIHNGHLDLRRKTGYRVSSMSKRRLLKIGLKTIEFKWRSFFWTPIAFSLEVYARLLGNYDYYIKKKNPYMWSIVPSTKILVTNDFKR